MAAALAGDDAHRASVELFTSLHQDGRALLVPAPVVAEVGYLLGREGSGVEAMFLRSLGTGQFVPVELSQNGYLRAAELVDQYADLPLGTTDATVIALAERLGLPEIATLDRRHFSVVRPRHVPSLTLLP